jgi:hypothetical protein
VRPEELFDLLYRIATGKKIPADPGVQAKVTTLLGGLGLNATVLGAATTFVDPAGRTRVQAAATQTANDLIAAFYLAAAALPSGPAQTAVQAAIAEGQAQAAAVAKNAANRTMLAANDAQAAIEKAYQKFEAWFESGQNRAQEWFVIHTKLITAVFGVIFAVFLQLDTIEIYQFVSTNSSVRDSLVAQAGAIQTQTAKLIGDGNGTLSDALAKWKAGLPAPVQNEVKDLQVEVSDTRASLRQRVDTALAGGAAANQADLLKAFDADVDQVARANLASGISNYNSIGKALDATGFPLYPSGGCRWKGDSPARWGQHILGMIFSAGLLSLGAPFWFNILKSLTNLRSTVASGVDDDKKKKSDEDTPSSAPVTVGG